MVKHKAKIFDGCIKNNETESKNKLKIIKPQGWRTKEEKKQSYTGNEPESNQQNGKNAYLSVITLHEDALNSLFKRHGVAAWIKNNTHLYTAYERVVSDVRIYIEN